jgi:quercetin dioxygenase-like cupin family protein
MLKEKLSNMTRGWFIGDFEPSVLKTKDFEVGILTHKKGEEWPKHYHKIATEYTVLLSGSMTICGELIEAGTIFVLEPGEVADPVFHEDCTVIVVKSPSVIGDKYVV